VSIFFRIACCRTAMALSTLRKEDTAPLAQNVHTTLRQMEKQRPCPVPEGHYRRRYRTIATYTIQLCEDFGLSTATTCRAFTLMARAFTNRRLNAEEQEPYFQLVVLVCVGIAAKYEEISQNQPYISELLDAADNAYTVQEFKDTERFVLNVLQWKVGDVTPACFASFYLDHSTVGDAKLNERVMTNFILLLGLSLQDPDSVEYLPSVISASALQLARTIAKKALQPEGQAIVDDWGDDMVALTGYAAADLRPCAGRLWEQYLFFSKEATDSAHSA
jgi:hypothetical protein